jgi:hypothetical protein
MVFPSTYVPVENDTLTLLRGWSPEGVFCGDIGFAGESEVAANFELVGQSAASVVGFLSGNLPSWLGQSGV